MSILLQPRTGHRLPSGRSTAIMGILNITPDSFSDGGEHNRVESALSRVEEMVSEGADLIDLGAESTRPGAEPVGEMEEWARLEPVILAIRERYPDLPLSVDTYKGGVAELALEAGVDWINDVWGGLYEEYHSGYTGPGTLAVAAKFQCPIILMHNRPKADYNDFWEDFFDDMERSISRARSMGVDRDLIWLDPGFGFGKEPRHNLEVLNHLGRLVGLGHPVMLGTSRKSTIGKVLNRPVEDRVWGTAATVAWGMSKGARMVRVHDVAEIKQTVSMLEAVQLGLHWKEPDHG